MTRNSLLTWKRRSFLRLCALAPLATLGGRGANAQETPPLLLESELLQHYLGDESAPHTLVEYSSLTCPHCARLHSDIYPRLLTDWVEPGRLRIVYRHFPLDGTAVRAALLAECLPSDEAFFAFVEILYQEQATWARAPDPATALLPYAALAGLDEERAQACMADEETLGKMSGEFERAVNELGIRGTPSLFLNGARFEHSADDEHFFEALEAETQS